MDIPINDTHFYILEFADQAVLAQVAFDMECMLWRLYRRLKLKICLKNRIFSD